MNRRRVALVAAALALPTVALVVSCTFPSPSFVDDGTGPDGSTQDAPNPTEAGADANEADGSDVDPNGRDAEAGLVDVLVVDASNCCDCDQDQYGAVDGGDASCVAPAGKSDCDDSIGALNPDSGWVQNTTWPPTAHTPTFDWDCDGKVTKQLGYNIPDCTKLSILNCSGEGFEGNPGCGQSGNYFHCGVQGAACVRVSDGNRTQACK